MKSGFFTIIMGVMLSLAPMTVACGGQHKPATTTSNDVTDLGPVGNYLVTLSDSDGNSFRIATWLSEVYPPTLTSGLFYQVQTPLSCNGDMFHIGDLNGTVSGNTFNPTLTAGWAGGSATISMQTTIASTQDAFSGTYSLSALPNWCLPINITSPTGTVTARQLPTVSGEYTGTLTDAGGNKVHVAFEPVMYANVNQEANLTLKDGTLAPGDFIDGTLTMSTNNSGCGPSTLSATILIPTSPTGQPVIGGQVGQYVILDGFDGTAPKFILSGLLDTTNGDTLTMEGQTNGIPPFGLMLFGNRDSHGDQCSVNYTGTLHN